MVVTVSVPGGEAMAGETTNVRLEILGGISILGTSGSVCPFSPACYRASVVQQIDVAAAQGERAVVLATGARSETARHFFDVCVAESCLGALALFCERARAACLTHAGWSFELQVVLVDDEGSTAVCRAGLNGAGPFLL